MAPARRDTLRPRDLPRCERDPPNPFQDRDTIASRCARQSRTARGEPVGAIRRLVRRARGLRTA